MLVANSRQYIHNAILMSGTGFHHWAYSPEYDHLNLAKKIAEDFGKPTDNFNELVETLVTAPAEKLVDYNWSNVTEIVLNFGVVIESKYQIMLKKIKFVITDIY